MVLNLILDYSDLDAKIQSLDKSLKETIKRS
jgi:hypothetical protein